MASIQLGDSSHNGMGENNPYHFSHTNLEEVYRTGSSWYLSRREIDEISPSRRDGIDLKKETYYRKSYCTYLQDLGKRLKVPQVTIATAIIFSHRFFLRQSHAKNDRRTIATVCMFLAGKVEETPRPLKDVILVSYEIIHKKDPAAAQRIKQREVYEQQKELILLGERVVLATLGFDLNVHHPYKPLVEAIKKFNVAQSELAQVAWNFVNDGLRTSLCLQFKPHHIAAGAIFLAAKFLKVKLPSDGEKVWWQEFDVTPRQLEEISNQLLELYEQNRVGQQSHGNETEASSAGGRASHRTTVKAPAAVEESSLRNGHTSPAGTTGMHHQPHLGRTCGTQRIVQNGSNDLGGNEPRGGFLDSKVEDGHKDRRHPKPGNFPEASSNPSNHRSESSVEEFSLIVACGTTEAKDRNCDQIEGPKGNFPMIDAIGKIDKDKVKAALEKRRKSRAEVARKMDIVDDDDLIERELESGIELAVEDERIKQERSSWFESFRQEPQDTDHGADNGNRSTETKIGKEGELSPESREFHLPEPASTKRRAVSPGKASGEKDGYDLHYHPALPSKHQES